MKNHIIYRKYIKRILDFIFAFILLILLSPLMVLVAIAIKMEDPKGPVLFKQKRPGKDTKIFILYKFRTMKVETKKNGKKLSDLERLTKVGSLLRKTSIDELPQLFNILKGEMSFIGPRPLLSIDLQHYSSDSIKMLRHKVLPGISGLAQVKGRNNLKWSQRFRYDVYYVENLSFFIDFKVFLLTLFVIFKREGINAKGEDISPVYTGNDEN